MKVAVALLLVSVVAVNAQIQVCDPNLKVSPQAGRQEGQEFSTLVDPQQQCYAP